MSDPPFESPFYAEEDDFSFPTQFPDDNPNTNPPPISQDTCLDDQPIISSLVPDYEDLSMFLDPEQNFAFLGQFPTGQDTKTIEWASQLITDDQLGLDGQVQQLTHGPSATAWLGTDQGDLVVHGPAGSATAVVGAGEGPSNVKKLDHNAKERVRRLKLNASYLALRSLLPDSKRPKEKWSAPYIIDRTLEYAPQLQAEIEKLTLEKSQVLSAVAQKQVLDSRGHEDPETNNNNAVTISINEVKRGEVIIQICLRADKLDSFSGLIDKLEGEGMKIVGASSLRASEDRSCFHLHIQIEENQLEDDYVADLHKKLISWLS